MARQPGGHNGKVGGSSAEMYSLEYVRERDALLAPIEERNRAGDSPVGELVNAARAACLRAWLWERGRARHG